jgi:hypothetical protein
MSSLSTACCDFDSSFSLMWNKTRRSCEGNGKGIVVERVVLVVFETDLWVRPTVHLNFHDRIGGREGDPIVSTSAWSNIRLGPMVICQRIGLSFSQGRREVNLG